MHLSRVRLLSCTFYVSNLAVCVPDSPYLDYLTRAATMLPMSQCVLHVLWCRTVFAKVSFHSRPPLRRFCSHASAWRQTSTCNMSSQSRLRKLKLHILCCNVATQAEACKQHRLKGGPVEKCSRQQRLLLLGGHVPPVVCAIELLAGCTRS